MSTTLFVQKVQYIRPLLRQDFLFSAMDSDAIIGNLAHETGGFAQFQEISPTVAGSRGGFGWAQWTGPRRKAFEAYCKRNNLDPFSDKANYAWLFLELKGSEKKAVAAVKKAVGLKAKVKAFEQSFERAGVKHYASRLMWAERAQAVPLVEDPLPVKTEPSPKTETKGKTMKDIFGNIIGVVSGLFGRSSTGIAAAAGGAGILDGCGFADIAGVDAGATSWPAIALLAFMFLGMAGKDGWFGSILDMLKPADPEADG